MARNTENEVKAEPNVNEVKAEPNVSREEYNALVEQLEAMKKMLEHDMNAKKIPAAETDNKWNERVEITLFKDDGKYKDDLFIAVNGRRFNVMRGVPVQVPLPVYEALKNSQDQDRRAVEMIGKLTSAANLPK